LAKTRKVGRREASTAKKRPIWVLQDKHQAQAWPEMLEGSLELMKAPRFIQSLQIRIMQI